VPLLAVPANALFTLLPRRGVLGNPCAASCPVPAYRGGSFPSEGVPALPTLLTLQRGWGFGVGRVRSGSTSSTHRRTRPATRRGWQ
jgi:hypothetical protein